MFFIHLVWTTGFREPIILPSFEEQLYDFIRKDFKKFDSNILAINRMSVKGSSSFWINQQKFIPKKFARPGGYCALSIEYNNYGHVGILLIIKIINIFHFITTT